MADVGLALFAFNIGVESGQLVVAAALLPVLWTIRSRPAWNARFVSVCSLLIAVVGSYWLSRGWCRACYTVPSPNGQDSRDICQHDGDACLRHWCRRSCPVYRWSTRVSPQRSVMVRPLRCRGRADRAWPPGPGGVSTHPGVGADGQYFWILARDPFLLNPQEIATWLDRPVYRAQRIGYPAFAAPWRLFGERSLLWGLLLGNIAVVAIGSYLTARLAICLGFPARTALAFAFNPGVIFSTMFDLCDALALAATVGALYAAVTRQRLALACFSAVAGLTKEPAVLALGAAALASGAGGLSRRSSRARRQNARAADSPGRSGNRRMGRLRPCTIRLRLGKRRRIRAAVRGFSDGVADAVVRRTHRRNLERGRHSHRGLRRRRPLRPAAHPVPLRGAALRPARSLLEASTSCYLPPMRCARSRLRLHFSGSIVPPKGPRGTGPSSVSRPVPG